MCSSGKPIKINIDKSGANSAALDDINKYLNNLIKQDHRFIKKITKLTLGFKAIHSAEATICGIELHHMLRKGQHLHAANQTVLEKSYALAG